MLQGNSYSSSRGKSGLPVKTWHHDYCLLRGRKNAGPIQANWAARVLHDCNSSLIHPDLLLQNISRDLVPDEGCSPGTQSESYGNKWLEDVLFTCCYNPQTKWWISFKHTVHCDVFKPKDMAYLKKKKKTHFITHCSSLVTCQQNLSSQQTNKKLCILTHWEVHLAAQWGWNQFHFYHVI